MCLSHRDSILFPSRIAASSRPATESESRIQIYSEKVTYLFLVCSIVCMWGREPGACIESNRMEVEKMLP